MMEYFWIDPNERLNKKYEDLFYDLYVMDKLSNFVYKDNPYMIVLNILAGLISGEKIVLVDSNLSKKEITNVGLNYDDVAFSRKNINLPKINTLEEFMSKIEENKNYWKLEIFPSGTMGFPKKVEHTLESLTRGVKKDINFKNNVWGFAYNPTHFAGLQILFQALLNANTIVYLFDQNPAIIPDILSSYRITHISATPTFYRKILPYLNKENTVLERITFGGEKFDKLLVDKIKKYFPKAKIRNIYASTEAGSLFSSKDETFKISERMKDKIKIENNELLVHKDLLGYSSQIELEDNWYRTGDLVEKNNENEFKFIARKDEIINVGGYKVNPHEIEEEIKRLDDIVDVVVKGRKNGVTGNILVAEIIYNGDLEEKKIEEEILNLLKINFQNWKIPRIFNIVKDVKQTRTSKKMRK